MVFLSEGENIEKLFYLSKGFHNERNISIHYQKQYEMAIPFDSFVSFIINVLRIPSWVQRPWYLYQRAISQEILHSNDYWVLITKYYFGRIANNVHMCTVECGTITLVFKEKTFLKQEERIIIWHFH